ncbi:TPA: hypothetical protein ACXDAZ_002675 [Clostridium botulinum]
MTNKQLQEIKHIEENLTDKLVDILNIDFNKYLETQNITDKLLKKFDTEHVNINTVGSKNKYNLAGDEPIHSYLGFRVLDETIKLCYIRKFEDIEFKFEIPDNLKMCGKKFRYSNDALKEYANRVHLDEINEYIKNIKIS